MSMIVEVESTTLQTFKKKDGGSFQMQEGYAHTVDFHGMPRRHPELIMFFPPKRDGVVTPVQPGRHLVGPKSFKVVNGRLELSFLDLVPVTGK